MQPYRTQWQEQGYLVLPRAIAPERIGRLRALCERVHDQWRCESTPGSEPANFHYQPNAWCVLHVNHPKYHRDSPADLTELLDMVADPLPLGIIEEILREAAVFEQSNLYIDPPGEPFSGGWHRDCQFFTAGDEERERADLLAEADPPRELHLHVPLVSTAATSVVPGSHRRWDTPEENRVRRLQPNSDIMPGAIRLQLEPGDLALFHVNALHRGHYPVGVPRRTIAITYGRASLPRPITVESMRDLHGYDCAYQPWLLNADYLDGVQENTRLFFERFIDVYGPYWQPEFLVPELGEKRIAYFRDYLSVPAGAG